MGAIGHRGGLWSLPFCVAHLLASQSVLGRLCRCVVMVGGAALGGPSGVLLGFCGL